MQYLNIFLPFDIRRKSFIHSGFATYTMFSILIFINDMTLLSCKNLRTWFVELKLIISGETQDGIKLLVGNIKFMVK